MKFDPFIYLAIPVLALELVMMVYVYQLQPRAWANRVFALYMLVLALSTGSSLVAGTAPTAELARIGSWLQITFTFLTGPLLWILLFLVFTPKSPRLRWYIFPLLILGVVPVLLMLTDGILGTNLIFRFDAANYAGPVYVSIRKYLINPTGLWLYWGNIVALNSGVLIPLVVFSVSSRIAPRLRRTARILTGAVLVTTVAYGLLRYVSFVLLSLTGPLFAATATAWAINLYRVFSPITVAQRQAVDTAVLGLMVFDENKILIDANRKAIELLTLRPRMIGHLHMREMFSWLAQHAENPDDLNRIWNTLQQDDLKPIENEEIRLRPYSPTQPNETRYINFHIVPLYDPHKLLIGYLFSLEDLTEEREVLIRLQRANEELQKNIHYVTLLNEITRIALQTENFSQSLQPIAQYMCRAFGADECVINLWDETRQIAIPVAATENIRRFLAERRPQSHELNITNYVLETGEKLVVPNVQEFPQIHPRLLPHIKAVTLLGLPMRAGDKKLGVILLGFNNPREFTEEDLNRADQMANQISLALTRIQALQSEREKRQQLEVLREASIMLSETLDLDTVLDRLLDQVGKVIPYVSATLMLVKDGQARMTRTRGYEPFVEDVDAWMRDFVLPIESTPNLKWMWEHKRPFIIPDMSQYDEWIKTKGSSHIASWAGAPITSQGQVIGYFSLDHTTPNFYQPHHAPLLESFASQASLAIQNARLFKQVQQRAAELEVLAEISASLRDANTVTDVVQLVLKSAIKALRVDVGVVFLLNPDSNKLVIQAYHPPELNLPVIERSLGEGITGRVALSQGVYISQNIAQDNLIFIRLDEELPSLQPVTMISVPLRTSEQVVGVLHLAARTGHTFTQEDIRLLSAISDMAGSALFRAQLLETLEERIAERTRDLEEANERLKELDRLKTKFVSDVSHELRIPIANLTLYLDLIERGSQERFPHYLTVLRHQTERLRQLVEDTLSLSRLDLGGTHIRFAPVSLNEVVAQVIEAHMPGAEMAGLSLSFEPQSDVPIIQAERNQLAQVVTNLVSNAMNYTQEGFVRVRTAYFPERQQVCLSVEDSGMGIDKEDLPHLFDRFYRGKRTGQSNIPGTGLGLAIVKEIVDLHGGTIEVSSEPNKGSIFRIWLPLVPPNWQENVEAGVNRAD
ncbi:MAG: GAF domain-containing protein [Chloroflexi bacterium]|nr:MAG: GAF domain-containing protein [Chloroflexota bacterium]